ncbi:hypothetical protein [Modestobacter sp. NPDC049651]|uniref:hypothetical protein n=1 Tax=unclassified Modestobacter TaxID=2643866 RepID=UPI003402B7CF
MRARLPLLVAVAAGLLTACGSGQPGPAAAGPGIDPGADATAAPAGDRCSAFSLSIADGVAGRPSPVAAAGWFADHGGVGGVPGAGWTDGGADESGAVVRSGGWTLHVVRLSDGTWVVDSGRHC